MFDFVVDLYALFCRLLADLASLWCDRFCIQCLRPCMDVLERVMNTTTTNNNKNYPRLFSEKKNNHGNILKGKSKVVPVYN
jgi:hypothetical protein